jgi:hypothetical protein
MGASVPIMLLESMKLQLPQTSMALKEETRFTMDLLQGQYFVMQVHQAS